MNKPLFYMTLGQMEGPLGENAISLLNNYRPQLAYAVRGGKNDPSGVTDVKDPNWQRFTQFVERNWT